MTMPTVTVPHEAFARVLREYALDSKKAIKDTYNSRMLDLVIKAFKGTKAADRSKLRSEFDTQRPTHSGNTMSWAAILANYRRKQKGLPPLGGKELGAAGRKLKAAVLRSINFIRSGWIPAMRIFTAAKNAAKTRGSASRIPSDAAIRGRPKGSARVATELLRPEAIAENTTKVASEIGTAAVAQAMAEVQAGMERILRRNIEDATRRHNGRVIR